MHDDLRAVEDRLAPWLAQRLGHAGPARCTLEPSVGGFSNLTWVGSWQPTGGDAQAAPLPIVLRQQSAVATVFPDPSIERQVRVMAALAGSAVPVPRLLGFEAGCERLGTPFFVMARVPGRVPQENPLYHCEGWFHDLDLPARRRHWFAGLDTLAAVARVDWQRQGLGFLAPPAGTDLLMHQLQAWQATKVYFNNK